MFCPKRGVMRFFGKMIRKFRIPLMLPAINVQKIFLMNGRCQNAGASKTKEKKEEKANLFADTNVKADDEIFYS